MEQFEEKLMDILEVDELHDEDVLTDFEDFDSLSILSIISIIGSDFKKTVTASQVKEAKTVGGLKKLVM